MKSISNFMNESFEINESSKHLIKIDSAEEASDKACDEAKKKRRGHDDGMMIEYHGKKPDMAADKFFEWYGVDSYYSKENNITYIPCTDEIEAEICYDEERGNEQLINMGLNI